MKIVFNGNELTKELKLAKEGEEILFYDRQIKSMQDKIEFDNYLSKLMMIGRSMNLKITGILSFTKQEAEK